MTFRKLTGGVSFLRSRKGRRAEAIDYDASACGLQLMPGNASKPGLSYQCKAGQHRSACSKLKCICECHGPMWPAKGGAK